MDQDQLFRRVLIAGVIGLLPVLLTYRIRSQAAREPLDRRQEGRFILFTLRPIAAAGLVGIAAYLIDPATMAWASVPMPSSLRWCGAAIAALGGVLTVWTFHTLGRNLTDTVVTRRNHTLVTHGPYRWVRHPFYGCVALLVAGNALLTANWFIAFTGALAVVLLVARTRREEDRLRARFGEAYRDYEARTGRFFPRRPSRA